MKKRNSITINTTQDGEENTYKSEGILTKKDDVYVLDYPDYAGNTHTDNHLEIGEYRMRLTRSGAFTSDMLFEEYMMTQGTYDVMFHHMNIEVYTTKYALSETDSIIEVELEYQLFDSGNELAKNNMKISIEKN